LDVVADAPALSPDERQLAYLVWTTYSSTPDLYVSTPDGAAPWLVSAKSDIRGWSADSRSLLAEIKRGGGKADLAVIPLDGGAQIVLASATGCGSDSCFADVSWGFPRP